MMFGPDSTTSPISPGAHSVPSGHSADEGWEQGAKGVDGGAVRLVGSYAS
jgi:hypothetical protein